MYNRKEIEIKLLIGNYLIDTEISHFKGGFQILQGKTTHLNYGSQGWRSN